MTTKTEEREIKNERQENAADSKEERKTNVDRGRDQQWRTPGKAEGERKKDEQDD